MKKQDKPKRPLYQRLAQGILLIMLVSSLVAGGARWLIDARPGVPYTEPATEKQEDSVKAPEAKPKPSRKKRRSKPEKLKNPKDFILLQRRNMVLLRGPITSRSIAPVMQKLIIMSIFLKSSETIYLVLDTPGGSIAAGNLFIDLCQSLPQKIKTLSLFSASMGFHIAQSLGERAVLPSSVLMSHRASIRGLSGEVPGEAVQRLNFIVKMVTNLERRTAARMKLSLSDYRELTRDELWINGPDGISQNVADRMVLARCAPSLSGTEIIDIPTFFGDVRATFSECPLIQAPLKVEFPSRMQKRKQFRVTKAEYDIFVSFINDLLFHPIEFTKKYIIPNTYTKYLK